jgi:transposase
MKTKKQEQQVKHFVAPKITDKEELHKYEESFKRWLSYEIHGGRLTIKQAITELGVANRTVYRVLKQYLPPVNITLPVMTEAEKKKLEKQQQRIRELEKQLEDAQVKNIALETLVDVAEKEFKIPIRKKPGAKQ